MWRALEKERHLDRNHQARPTGRRSSENPAGRARGGERACTSRRSAPRREWRTHRKRRSTCGSLAPPGVHARERVHGCTSRSAPRESACGRTGAEPQTRFPVEMEAPEACQPPPPTTDPATIGVPALLPMSCATDTNPDPVDGAPISSTTMDVASGAAFRTAASRLDFTDAAVEPQPLGFRCSRSVTTASSLMETSSALAACDSRYGRDCSRAPITREC